MIGVSLLGIMMMILFGSCTIKRVVNVGPGWKCKATSNVSYSCWKEK